MPTFTFNGPNGEVKVLNGPEGATQEQAIQIAHTQGFFGKATPPPQAPQNASSTPPMALATPSTGGLEQVRTAISQLGVTDPAEQGAWLGNIAWETGGSFDPHQQQKGGGTGHGLFQFSKGGLKESYFEWLGDQPDTIATQLKFTHAAIYGGGVANGVEPSERFGRGNAKKLRSVLQSDASTEEKTKAFSEIYLRPGKPHLKKRVSEAQRLTQIG